MRSFSDDAVCDVVHVPRFNGPATHTDHRTFEIPQTRTTIPALLCCRCCRTASLWFTGVHVTKVSGPAVLALSQMAHHEACQRALGLAGGVPPLVLLCFTSQSPAVLTQVSQDKSSNVRNSICFFVRDAGRGCVRPWLASAVQTVPGARRRLCHTQQALYVAPQTHFVHACQQVTNPPPAPPLSAFETIHQACISLAQLSRYPPNRAIIAGKGGIAAMVHLLEGFRIEERVTAQVGVLLVLVVGVVSPAFVGGGHGVFLCVRCLLSFCSSCTKKIGVSLLYGRVTSRKC